MSYHFPESPLSEKNCHPAFAANAKDKFFYDLHDYFGPFGHNDAAEIFFQLSDWLQEGGELEEAEDYLNSVLYEEWGCDEDAAALSGPGEIQERFSDDILVFEMLDRGTIGFAFGMVYITGSIPNKILKRALVSIRRQLAITDYCTKENFIDTNKCNQQADGKVLRPNSADDLSNIYSFWEDRLRKMEKALLEFSGPSKGQRA